MMKITKINKIKIEELFNIVEHTSDYERNTSKDYVINPWINLKTESVNNDLKLEHKPIKYIMKHKVKKHIFKIKCNGDEVKVTEDHSIMIIRNNILISVKPAQIIHGDKIVKRDKFII